MIGCEAQEGAGQTISQDWITMSQQSRIGEYKIRLRNLTNIMHGRVKMYVMRWPFCWTTFLLIWHQVVGIPMGTNCAPLVADLFLFCYERDFMMSLSDDKQADVIDAFNTTSRYLDDI